MRRGSNTEQSLQTARKPSSSLIRTPSVQRDQTTDLTTESHHVLQAVGANNLLVRSALQGRRGSPRMGVCLPEDVANFFRRLRPTRTRNSPTQSSSSIPQLRGVRLQFETDHLMRKRSDSNRFFCAVCGVAYVRKQDLRQHILRLHSIGSRTDGGLSSVCILLFSLKLPYLANDFKNPCQLPINIPNTLKRR